VAIIIDPEQNEVRALQHIPDWPGKRVIEIGCGSGRLTLRLAQLGANVYALDPNLEQIEIARTELPKKYSGRVHYDVGGAEHVARGSESFDLAVFSWVL
jgi:2-polyprenyl-6-hydroxyphenyl methylase / 3-demethylubiquinone-9 3-methyltransferase